MSAPDTAPTWEQPPATPSAKAPARHIRNTVLSQLVGLVLGACVTSFAWMASVQQPAPAPAANQSLIQCDTNEVADFRGTCVDASAYEAADAVAEGVYQMGKDSYDLWRKKTKHLGKIPPLTFFCAATTRWEGAFYIANAYGLGQDGFTTGLSSKSGTETHVSLDRKNPLTAVFRCSKMPGWARVEPLNIEDPDVP